MRPEKLGTSGLFISSRGKQQKHVAFRPLRESKEGEGESDFSASYLSFIFPSKRGSQEGGFGRFFWASMHFCVCHILVGSQDDLDCGARRSQTSFHSNSKVPQNGQERCFWFSLVPSLGRLGPGGLGSSFDRPQKGIMVIELPSLNATPCRRVGRSVGRSAVRKAAPTFPNLSHFLGGQTSGCDL